jgi:hypothetical protein
MTRRITPNILEEIGQIAALEGNPRFPAHDGALGRYGADLIGRAIAHEHQADPVDLGAWAPIIADIRTDWPVTRQITMHNAISEVMIGA